MLCNVQKYPLLEIFFHLALVFLAEGFGKHIIHASLNQQFPC